MNLIGLIGFLIVLSQVLILFQLKAILKELKHDNFSREDAIVRAMTKNVQDAKDRIPHL